VKQRKMIVPMRLTRRCPRELFLCFLSEGACTGVFFFFFLFFFLFFLFFCFFFFVLFFFLFCLFCFVFFFDFVLFIYCLCFFCFFFCFTRLVEWGSSRQVRRCADGAWVWARALVYEPQASRDGAPGRVGVPGECGLFDRAAPPPPRGEAWRRRGPHRPPPPPPFFHTVGGAPLGGRAPPPPVSRRRCRFDQGGHAQSHGGVGGSTRRRWSDRGAHRVRLRAGGCRDGVRPRVLGDAPSWSTIGPPPRSVAGRERVRGAADGGVFAARWSCADAVGRGSDAPRGGAGGGGGEGGLGGGGGGGGVRGGGRVPWRGWESGAREHGS